MQFLSSCFILSFLRNVKIICKESRPDSTWLVSGHMEYGLVGVNHRIIGLEVF